MTNWRHSVGNGDEEDMRGKEKEGLGDSGDGQCRRENVSVRASCGVGRGKRIDHGKKERRKLYLFFSEGHAAFLFVFLVW
jgi:hypothetical protein